MKVLAQPVALQAQHIDRYVLATGQRSRCVVFGIADIQPHTAAIADSKFRPVIAGRTQDLGQDEFDEQLFAEPHESAIGQHGNGGIARAVGNQGFFTKGHARAEISEMNLAAAGGDGTRHFAVAALDHIVVIARRALLYHHFVGLVGDLFHVREDALNVGCRQHREQLRLQHAYHPVR